MRFKADGSDSCGCGGGCECGCSGRDSGIGGGEDGGGDGDKDVVKMVVVALVDVMVKMVMVAMVAVTAQVGRKERFGVTSMQRAWPGGEGEGEDKGQYKKSVGKVEAGRGGAGRAVSWSIVHPCHNSGLAEGKGAPVLPAALLLSAEGEGRSERHTNTLDLL